MSKFATQSVSGTIKRIDIDQLEDGSADLIAPRGITGGFALVQSGSDVLHLEPSRIYAQVVDQR